MRKFTASDNTQRSRQAFTILELLVVIALIGMLLALILPAVQQARETSRRITCRSHLKQLGIALYSYELTHGCFPPFDGRCDRLYVDLLPYIDQTPLYEEARSWWETGTIDYSMNVSLYICPSETIVVDDGATGPGYYPSYLINQGSGLQTYGLNGFDKWFVLRTEDITDGMSNTAALSEKMINTFSMADDDSVTDERRMWSIPHPLIAPDELDAFADSCLLEHFNGDHNSEPVPWIISNYGYNHVLPPNSPSCWNGNDATDLGARSQNAARTASSLHAGGVNLLLADGSCRFIASQVDRHVWRAVGSRNGNDLIGDF